MLGQRQLFLDMSWWRGKMGRNLPLPWYLQLNSHPRPPPPLPRHLWLSCPHARSPHFPHRDPVQYSLNSPPVKRKCTPTSAAIVVTQLQSKHTDEKLLISSLMCLVTCFSLSHSHPSHTTLGWDVLFRSSPSTPLQAYFTMLYFWISCLERKEEGTRFITFSTLIFSNSNETRLRDSFLLSAKSWTKLCRPVSLR